MSEITAIFAEYSMEGKLEFQTWKAVPVDGIFRVDFGDDLPQAFNVPEALYLNGVREFLYTKASTTPIDFTTGKHGSITPAELAMVADNVFLRQMMAMERGIEVDEGISWIQE